ncbi:aspartate aminotransferase family protein [Lewinellaceae bacterium SD302]|nr:aspartate aminotransferase family protein [Lewinellaceae bacterium SD302]
MKPFAVYPLMPINIQRASGSWVWDENDRKYLDFYGGHAVISIGHSHPHFVARLKDQLDRVAFYSNSVLNPLRDQLAAKVGELSGYPDYQLFIVNSGAEAVENALKLASFHNGRSKVIAFERGFHGRTSAAVHVTDNPKIAASINRGFERVILPWNDLEAVQDQLAKEDVCALIIEGIQGIGGVHLPAPEFLRELQSLCTKHGTLLVLDEIQSGYGRSGKFFAHQYAGIRPDLITIAKGMGNGFPIGGVMISPKVEASFGLLGTTFGGTHLACAAGLAVLEVIEAERLQENILLRGKELMEGLRQFDEVVEVRGAGGMIGVELPFSAKDFRQRLVQEFGVFTGSSSQPNTLRVLPPLSIMANEVAVFLEAFGNCLSTHQQPVTSHA